MDVGYLLIGLALGVGTSVIPGPCGLAVMAAACDHGRPRAIATATGAAIGDASYAARRILGVGGVIARHPGLPPVLRACSGLALIAYGLYHLACAAPVVAAASTPPTTAGGAWRGGAVGLAIVLANPASLVTWVVLVGASLGTASAAMQLATILGIGLGTGAWYTGVAVVVRRGAERSPHAMRRLTRAVCCLLISYGTITLVRLAV